METYIRKMEEYRGRGNEKRDKRQKTYNIRKVRTKEK